jgi:amino acid transporter
MNVNVMVCSAIFIMPTLMAQKAGYASVLGWPLVALIMTPIVLCTANMARLFPGAGGFYSYCKNIISPTAGFMSGWAFYLGYTGVAVVLSIFLRDNILASLFPVNSVLFNIFFVLGITLLSLLNIKTIGRIQSTGTIFKILPLLFVLAVFLAYWNPAFSITLASLKSVPATVPFVLFGFWGFETCCTISHLIKGDKRNASRAMLTAFGLVSILYTMFHFGILHIMGAENLASAGSAREFVYYLGLSPSMEAVCNVFLSLTLIIVFMNAIFSVFVAVSSTLHTMSSRDTFPCSQALTKVNKWHRPWVAILSQGLLVFVCTCFITNKSVLVGMINFGILVAFLLVLIALFILQRRTGERKRIGITVAAFCSWFLLAYFGWMDKDLGATHLAKIISTLPLGIAFVVGYAMHRYKKSEQSTEA